MSDRPMRLKYLTTKMKIILCIFLLCITVSVFGQSQELNGIVGKSIEFPAAVETSGNLIYSSKVIGRVLSAAFISLTDPKYDGRVQWNKSTGRFSLSGLRLEDSGVYTVEKDDGQISVSTFSLTVWIPVSKPHVRVTHNKYPCTILCAAARGTGATLTLYKNSEKNPYVTSPVRSHPHLDMTQTVESGTYTCEANNSVSSETSDPLTVEDHCTARPCPSPWTIVLGIFAAVAVPSAVVFFVKYRHTKSELEVFRRTILVKKLLDSLVLPAYDQPVLPRDAVRKIFLVKNLLDNLVPPAYGEDEHTLIRDAVGRIFLVKKLFDSLVLPASADRTIVQVKKLFDSLVLPASGKAMVAFPPDDEEEKALIRDAVGRIFLGKAMVAFPPDSEYMPALTQDAVRRIVEELRGVSKRKNELEEKKEIPPPSTDM